MAERPAIDVVIAAYQAERWIGDAIASVLAQQDAPLGQVLVVDNGSSDGTAAVAGRFPAPVRCLSTGRTGSAHARNVGIAAATAPFLALLDADDLMPPGSLSSRLAALQASGGDLVGGLVLPFRDGQPLPADCESPALRPWTQRAQLSGTLLFRRTLLGARPFDESLNGAEISDWLVAAADAGVQPVMIDRVVLLRRLHPDSMTRADFGRVTQDYFKILRRHLRRREGAD